MDVVGVVLPLLGSALEHFERTREWHIVANVKFLQVFDVPWDEGLESRIMLSLESPPVQIEGIPQALQALPALSSRSYRFFISENIDCLENLQLLHGLTRQNPGSPGSSSFAGLRSQWRSQHNARAWLSSSYSMVTWPENDANRHGSPPSFTASLMRLTKRIRVSQYINDRVFVFITCSSESTMSSTSLERMWEDGPGIDLLAIAHAHKHLSDFCRSLRATLSSGLTNKIPNDANSSHVSIKLMLLAFCHCGIDQLLEFIEKVQRVYDSVREPTMNPRVGKPLTQNIVRDVINDAYFYEKFRECVAVLTSATLPLLELLSIDFASNNEFKYAATELRALCEDLKRSSAQLTTRLESNMRLFELLRSFHESSKVQLLGLLAAIFLPLSLASSLLSMQTRLVDLHYLLYDFCGVIVLLGTIVLIIVVLLKLFAKFKDKLAEWKSDTSHFYIPWVSIRLQYGVLGWLVVVWALLLSSFLVGMVRDVPLGLKILGYGSIVTGAVFLILALGAVFLWQRM